jgi:serine/threonine protein kinase/tetratricopeptide (TPR) repeat protein
MEPNAFSRVFGGAAPGTIISHYELVAPLGSGGMGLVYKAFDTRLKRPVALKFLNQQTLESEQGSKRFLFEAQAAAALDHPNICPIYEIEDAEGCTFIVMACISGVNLRKKIASAPPTLEEALEIALQIAQGLLAAHERGLVHRDIKPANIIVSDDGIIKIVDFGLAQRPDSASVTEAGALVGTLTYMSPEQADGERVDRRTDLWSWGVILYEMLVGVPPFRGDNALALLNAIAHKAPEPVRNFRPGIPNGVEQMIDRALEKVPDQRYQSAREIIKDLGAVLGKTVDLPSADRGTVPRGSGGAVSIAVLPFVNTSSDKENEVFSDGLTDELINVLAHCQGLRVVSRTSAFAFKGKAESIRSIGEQLHVDAILEGSVRRAGERLRVTAQLINVSDGYHAWSGKFDREMKDIFEIQDEIAQTVANALEISLQPGQKIGARGAQRNLEAYQHYLKGRYYWNQMTAEGFQKAVAHFEEALKIDPLYGAAHAGLADYFTLLGVWSLAVPSEVWPRAKAAATRALELDNSLPEAHMSLGYVHIFYEWDRKQAERDFRRAVELNPGLSLAHYSYAIYLIQTGRLEEAIQSMMKAKDLDPLSLLVCSGLAFVYYYNRQYHRALEEHRKVLELDPHYVYSLFGQGLVYQELGLFKEAIEFLEKARASSGGSSLILGFLGDCYGRAGMREKSLEILKLLDQQVSQMYVSPVCQALVYIGLGESGRALDWLEKAAESRAVLLTYLPVMPPFDPLRSEPRLIALERRMAIPVTEPPTL